MSKKNSHQIEVSVTSNFVTERSDINNNLYYFSYRVTIKNKGSQAAQLISRHWVITAADGETNEVKGLGVIGEQPLIEPNEEYIYSSNTMFEVPSGTMHGTYQMVAEDGTQFEVDIPLFTCNMPRVLH
jgi:ApaG protein